LCLPTPRNISAWGRPVAVARAESGIPVASIVFTVVMLVSLVPLMGQAIVQTHAGADGAAANGQLSGSSEKSTLGICVRVGSCRQISKQRSPKGRIGGTAVEDASSSHYRNCQMPKRQGRAGQRGTTACDSEMLQTENSDCFRPFLDRDWAPRLMTKSVQVPIQGRDMIRK
jgi:hypothetical protein